MKKDKERSENDTRANILIIDDDEGISYTLARMAQDEGHMAKTALTLTEGLPLALSGEYEVLFLDVRLPDGNGIDIIPKIQAMPFPPEIIIITAYGDKGGAKTALKSGVWDFIEKPARINELKLSLIRALQYRSQKKTLKTPLAVDRAGIIGNSSKLLMYITLMAHAAKSDANVLISGETGTGKELFARAIHLNSSRVSKPFVVLDCTTMPQYLAESILFGHVKGAFTGADKDQIGLIKQADGGTFFLDEVGELPLSLQKTLLRVLQERRFRPVGSKEEIVSNFRLVSATYKDLEEEVEAGRFRQDLLFRLRTFVIELPALRGRDKDIKEIAVYHVEKFCKNSGLNIKTISKEFFEALCQYEWPGNVRELVSTLESAVALEPHYPTLFPKHLPNYIRAHSIGRTDECRWIDFKDRNRTTYHPDELPTMKEYRRQAVKNAEKQYLYELLECSKGDINLACKVSGLKRARLYQLIKKYRFSKSFETSSKD